MKIIFVCHGSICRSPAAEWIAKQLAPIYLPNVPMEICSRALSHEEIGNDIYPPMKRALFAAGVPFEPHHAAYLSTADAASADIIFYMDHSNEMLLKRHYPGVEAKCAPITLLEKKFDEVEDPWYTGRYDLVVSQIRSCVFELFHHYGKTGSFR